MKKNKMMRLASFLLIAVLVSTSAISGTYAKYVTTAGAQDSARVAKWGVEVTATGNAAFATKYDDETGDDGTKVVSDVKVVAPGTEGDLAAITIEGSPEVVVDVDVNATLTLTGWEIDGVEYCPIVFTVGNEEIKIDGVNITTVAALKAAVEAKFNAMDKNDVAVGTDLADSIAISWAWPFSTSEANDEKDTDLGDLAAAGFAPTITFACDVTVEQVD